MVGLLGRFSVALFRAGILLHYFRHWSLPVDYTYQQRGTTVHYVVQGALGGGKLITLGYLNAPIFGGSIITSGLPSGSQYSCLIYFAPPARVAIQMFREGGEAPLVP